MQITYIKRMLYQLEKAFVCLLPQILRYHKSLAMYNISVCIHIFLLEKKEITTIRITISNCGKIYRKKKQYKM